MLQIFKGKRNEDLLEVLKHHKLDNHKVYISLEEIKKLLKFGELNPVVYDFIIKYNLFFNEYNSLLLHNLKRLHIYIGYCDDKEINGLYIKNRMDLFIPREEEYNPHDDVLIDTVYHELLHVATSDRKVEMMRSGISKKIGRYNLGHKLNEGYTEHLTGKYFAYNITDDYYYKERKYAENVERLLGKDVMEEAYFTGDLYTIIKGLGEYIEDPLEFMIKTDRGLIDPNETLDKIEAKRNKILIKR